MPLKSICNKYYGDRSPKWNNCLISIRFIQWYCLIKPAEYLCEITTGENRVGSWWKRREREQFKGVRDGALDRRGSGVGEKWPLEKRTTWIILVMQINRINKLSIKLGWFQILQFLWCRNICSHNSMFCHNTLV